jgi:hypothetical protein
MKNLIAIFILLVLAVNTYANTTDVPDKGRKKKQQKALASVMAVVEEEPVSDLTGVLTSGKSEVNVKVFDITGKIVFEKKVNIESILSNKYRIEELPKRSVFVMLHNNIAYFFQEEGK